MCGRFKLNKNRKDLMDCLEVGRWNPDFTWQPSYNIAPTQEIPVLTCKNKLTIQGMFWGLIPNWSKDMKFGGGMINARSETLTERPSYASLLHSQRCIVIADGYYEWRITKQGKKPYYIHNPENNILSFAGLWDKWENGKKQHRISCTIITTEPSEQLKHIHNRMPVILTKDSMDVWVDCNYPKDKALQLLKPYKQTLNYYPISTFVNSPVNNSQKCIEPMIMEE